MYEHDNAYMIINRDGSHGTSWAQVGCLHHQFEELHGSREEGAVIGLHDQHLIRWPPPDHGVLLLWVHHVVMCGLYVHSSCFLQPLHFVEPCAG